VLVCQPTGWKGLEDNAIGDDKTQSNGITTTVYTAPFEYQDYCQQDEKSDDSEWTNGYQT